MKRTVLAAYIFQANNPLLWDGGRTGIEKGIVPAGPEDELEFVVDVGNSIGRVTFGRLTRPAKILRCPDLTQPDT